MEPSMPAAAPAPHATPTLPSAFKLFQPSIDALRTNLGTIIALVLAPFAIVLALFIGLITSAPSAGSTSPGQSANIAVILLTMVIMVAFVWFSMVLSAALTAAQLKGAQHQRLSFGNSLHIGMRFWWRSFLLSLLSGLLIMAGLMLFIVPGIFLMQRLLLAPYYLIDRDLGPIEAMKQSFRDAKRFSGAVWGLMGVTLLVAIVGIIPILGWIVEILYFCAQAVRYNEIKEASGHGTPAPAAPVAPAMHAPFPPQQPPAPQF